MSRVAYVAGPIDLVGDEGRGVGWDELRTILEGHGYIIYNPMLAWTASVPDRFTAQRLWRVNEVARFGADLVVGTLPMGVSSIGVPAELALSVEEDKLVAVITDHTKSWMLEAWNRELRATDRGGVFKSLREFELWLGAGDGVVVPFIKRDDLEAEERELCQREGFDEPAEGR